MGGTLLRQDSSPTKNRDPRGSRPSPYGIKIMSWQRSERGRRTIQALAKGYGGEYQNEFEILINQVTGISRGLLKAFYISGLKPTLQCSLLRLNPTTLDEAFLLACATKARFTNLQLLALLRSNPTTLGEAFFRTLITEARFENENNQAVDNNVGDQEDPNVNDKQEVKKADDEEIKTVKDEERKNVEDQQVSKADDDTNNDDFDCSLPPHKWVNLTVEKIVFENTTSDLRRTRMSNFHVDRQDIVTIHKKIIAMVELDEIRLLLRDQAAAHKQQSKVFQVQMAVLQAELQATKGLIQAGRYGGGGQTASPIPRSMGSTYLRLLISFYVSGLKPAIQWELLVLKPTSLGDAFSLARVTEARLGDQVEMHRGITWDKVENPNPQSTPQVLPSLEESTPPVTYPDEIEEIIGIPIEKPQTQPFPYFPSLEVDLGEERGPEPPIKSPSTNNFRMKEVDNLTNHTPPTPHVASFHPKDTYCYYHPCIGDPKKHYGLKPGLLGHSGSLGVDFSNTEIIENEWELESKEVCFLGRRLNSLVRPKEIEKVIFDKKKLGSS
ncbi:hypothetical protein Tco_1244205 [Tanacetum coccineum]